MKIEAPMKHKILLYAGLFCLGICLGRLYLHLAERAAENKAGPMPLLPDRPVAEKDVRKEAPLPVDHPGGTVAPSDARNVLVRWINALPKSAAPVNNGVILGQVTTWEGAPLAGITVSAGPAEQYGKQFSGGDGKAPTIPTLEARVKAFVASRRKQGARRWTGITDSTGHYRINGLDRRRSHALTLKHPDYIFRPLKKSAMDPEAEFERQDYVAYPVAKLPVDVLLADGTRPDKAVIHVSRNYQSFSSGVLGLEKYSYHEWTPSETAIPLPPGCYDLHADWPGHDAFWSEETRVFITEGADPKKATLRLKGHYCIHGEIVFPPGEEETEVYGCYMPADADGDCDAALLYEGGDEIVLESNRSFQIYTAERGAYWVGLYRPAESFDVLGSGFGVFSFVGPEDAPDDFQFEVLKKVVIGEGDVRVTFRMPPAEKAADNVFYCWVYGPDGEFAAVKDIEFGWHAGTVEREFFGYRKERNGACRICMILPAEELAAGPVTFFCTVRTEFYGAKTVTWTDPGLRDIRMDFQRGGTRASLALLARDILNDRSIQQDWFVAVSQGSNGDWLDPEDFDEQGVLIINPLEAQPDLESVIPDEEGLHEGPCKIAVFPGAVGTSDVSYDQVRKIMEGTDEPQVVDSSHDEAFFFRQWEGKIPAFVMTLDLKPGHNEAALPELDMGALTVVMPDAPVGACVTLRRILKSSDDLYAWTDMIEGRSTFSFEDEAFSPYCGVGRMGKKGVMCFYNILPGAYALTVWTGVRPGEMTVKVQGNVKAVYRPDPMNALWVSRPQLRNAADLAPGDAVVAIDGHRFKGFDELDRLLAAHSGKASVPVTALRGVSAFEVTLSMADIRWLMSHQVLGLIPIHHRE